MAYYPPDFNLIMNVWLGGANPLTTAPAITARPCQLYRYSRLTTASSPAIIRIPFALGWIDGPQNAFVVSNPVAECPAGSGCFYRINAAVHMHRGFANAYIALRADPIIVTLTGAADSASDTDLL